MKERIARRRGPRHTRHRGAKLTLAASAATLAVASCAPASAGTDDIEVVASFYPLQFVAQEVGGSEISVTNLTPSGAEPHDLELTTRNVLTLEEADVVMTLSGFQPALDDALSERSEEHTSELQSRGHLVCRLVLEKKDNQGPHPAGATPVVEGGAHGDCGDQARGVGAVVDRAGALKRGSGGGRVEDTVTSTEAGRD